MSHEMLDGELVFNCDGVGGRHCNKNYSAGDAKFKETRDEAKAMGWSFYARYRNGVNEWMAACPDCAKKLGD
jgi:hypothetical protein